MFGYIIANPKELSPEDKQSYRAAYCGVCHALRAGSGVPGRFMLAYEPAFLALILLSVYGEDPEILSGRCIAHPAAKHEYMSGKLIDYAADMNFLLMYYKLLDDVKDDGNPAAYAASKAFTKRAEELMAAYPVQAEAIMDTLEALRDMEAVDEMNPDIPANCFGRLMGAVFAPYDDDKAPALYAFGAALGRFIYILDAVDDLKSDIRKKRYNPLIMSDPRMFGDILAQLMNDAVRCAEHLDIGKYRQLIENVLYSGVWMKYKRGKKETNQ